MGATVQNCMLIEWQWTDWADTEYGVITSNQEKFEQKLKRLLYRWIRQRGNGKFQNGTMEFYAKLCRILSDFLLTSSERSVSLIDITCNANQCANLLNCFNLQAQWQHTVTFGWPFNSHRFRIYLKYISKEFRYFTNSVSAFSFGLNFLFLQLTKNNRMKFVYLNLKVLSSHHSNWRRSLSMWWAVWSHHFG